MTTMTRPSPSPAAAPAAVPAEAPIPMRRLVRVEWSKATDTRSARWLIGLSALATVAIMLVPLLNRGGVDQIDRSYLFFAATGATILLPVVSIMTLTTEWTQRTVLTTFVQEPRRSRVISAKVTVSMIMAAVGVVFAGLVSAGAIGVATASGRHIGADLGAASLIGFVLFIVLNMLMGVAFGALLHNTAASIVLFFLLPTVFGILGASIHSVGHWIDPSTTFAWVQRGAWSGHTGQIVTSIALWVVVPLVAGLVRTARREIK